VSTTQGIDSFRDPRITTFSAMEGWGKDAAIGVLAGKNGTLWVANSGSLDSIAGGRVSSIRIDPAVLANHGLEGHHGLRGMPERAALIGGTLAVWSEVGAGAGRRLTLKGTRHDRYLAPRILTVDAPFGITASADVRQQIQLARSDARLDLRLRHGFRHYLLEPRR
jgi:hypothetical protein